jgi:glycosyltransferase involved in cell wall biosynthesis
MDDPTIRVSVVMPAYNAAATIGRAIASALRQTESRLEVIVVDDASTDGTAAVAQRVATRDRRVHVVELDANCGAGAARNQALAQARGEWVALLDADDEFVPHRLQHLLVAAEQCGADVVSDNLLLCQGPGEHVGVPMISPHAIPVARWMSAAEFVAGNVGSRYTPRVSYGFLKPLIRRGFLNRNDIRYEERNRFGEDFLLSLSCLLSGARWWLMPDTLYRYTVRAGSATDVQSAADLLRIHTLEENVLRTHPMACADPALAAALRRHKAVIEHFYYYRAFTDALKARAVAPALRLLFQNPKGIRHILTESVMQAPRVAFKALRGGFRGGRPGIPRHGDAGAAANSVRRA